MRSAAEKTPTSSDTQRPGGPLGNGGMSQRGLCVPTQSRVFRDEGAGGGERETADKEGEQRWPLMPE